MKEQSIEQKAEAYDEAVENMRKFRDALNNHEELDLWVLKKEIVKDIEYYFPELKESEDEKIRKKLISFVKNWDKGGIVSKYTSNANDIKRILAWLEKHKPVEHFELRAGHWYICHRAYCCRADHLTVKEGERFMCEKDGMVKGFVIKDAEKYFKECSAPAPMEDDQNDEVRRRSTIQVLEYARSLDTYNQYGKADIDKNISWLEKQGEQSIKWNKNTKGNKPQVNHSVLMNTTHGIAEGEWNGDDSWIQYRWASSVKDSDVLFWIKLSDLEEQGEQRTANSYCQENCKGFQETGKCFADGDCKAKREAESVDKVEPKFNFSVGQWIVATGKCVYLITKIDGFNVTLVDVDGNEYVFDTSSLEDAHLWTIQDAKEGDVLAFYCEYKGNKMVQVGIIEKYVGKHGGCSNTFKIYVGVNWENNLIIGEYMGCPDIRPATKEQRDKLFEKMHEAEYVWDTEKKELKKIEESENIKNQIMSEITDLVKDYITQKSAKCSEEDELSCFESALFTAFSDAWQSYLLGEEVNVKQWTKEHSKELLEAAKEELKGHNSARSEEDEGMIKSICEGLQDASNEFGWSDFGQTSIDSIIDWLKSFKDRIIA